MIDVVDLQWFNEDSLQTWNNLFTNAWNIGCDSNFEEHIYIHFVHAFQ